MWQDIRQMLVPRSYRLQEQDGETSRRLLHARVVLKPRLPAVPTCAGLRERAQTEGLRTPSGQCSALPQPILCPDVCRGKQIASSRCPSGLGRQLHRCQRSLVRRLQIFQSLSPPLPRSCRRQLYTMEGRRASSCQSRGSSVTYEGKGRSARGQSLSLAFKMAFPACLKREKQPIRSKGIRLRIKFSLSLVMRLHCKGFITSRLTSHDSHWLH